MNLFSELGLSSGQTDEHSHIFVIVSLRLLNILTEIAVVSNVTTTL